MWHILARAEQPGVRTLPKEFHNLQNWQGFENPDTPRSDGGTGLNWQGAVSSDMPDLR